MKIEKVIRDGMVAVLYSPGFGAGWTTWQHSDEISEFVTFDRRIVEAVEHHATSYEIETLLKEIFGDNIYISTSSWSNIKIKWLPVGTRFEIMEYDGSESIRIFDEGDYYVA